MEANGAQRPNDVDLMVIDEPDLGAMYDPVRQVEESIGLPINVVVRTRAEWLEDDSGFAQTVKEIARIPLEVG